MPTSTTPLINGRITAANAIIFAEAAYDPIGSPLKGLGDNWTELQEYGVKVGPSSAPVNQMRVIVNSDANQITLNIKGSNNLSNFYSDLANAGASAYAQIRAGVLAAYDALVIDYPGFEIVVTGHSLGGGAAQSVALEKGIDGFGFNSLPIPPGTLDLISPRIGNITTAIEEYRAEHRFIETNVAGDIATTTYSSILRGVYLDEHPTTLPSSLGFFSQAGMVACIGAQAWGCYIGFGAAATAHQTGTLKSLISNYALGADGQLIVAPSSDGVPVQVSLTTNADGSYQKTFLDREGNLVSLRFDAQGNPLGDTWQTRDGARGSDDFYSPMSGGSVQQYEVSLNNTSGGTTRDTVKLNTDGSVRSEEIRTTTASGAVSAVLRGTDIVTRLDGAEVTIEANSSATVYGEGATFHFDGTGIWASIIGSDARVFSTESGNTIGLSGENQVVHASGNAVWFDEGTAGTIIGSGNTFVANGTDIWANIVGSNTNVLSSVGGNTISLTGSNEHINSVGDAIWFNHDTSGTIVGSGNTFVANGTDIRATIVGSNTNVISSVGGNTIGLTGINEHIYSVGDAIWFGDDTTGTIIGSGNTFVANGTDIWANIVGSNTNAISAAAGNAIILTGDNQHVTASGNTIRFNGGTDGFIRGTDNHLIEAGTDIQVRVEGSLSSFTSTSHGNLVDINGNQYVSHTDPSVVLKGAELASLIEANLMANPGWDAYSGVFSEDDVSGTGDNQNDPYPGWNSTGASSSGTSSSGSFDMNSFDSDIFDSSDFGSNGFDGSSLGASGTSGIYFGIDSIIPPGSGSSFSTPFFFDALPNYTFDTFSYV